MPIEPWWETNPATTPRQELGMVSPERGVPGTRYEHKDTKERWAPSILAASPFPSRVPVSVPQFLRSRTRICL